MIESVRSTEWRELSLPFAIEEFPVRLAAIALPYSTSPLGLIERLGDKRKILYREMGKHRELFVRGYIDGFLRYEVAAEGKLTRLRYQRRAHWIPRVLWALNFAIGIPGAVFVIYRIAGNPSKQNLSDWLTLLALAIPTLAGVYWIVRDQRESQWRELERAIQSMTNDGLGLDAK